MKIIDALKLESETLRVSNGDRWLVCVEELFIVYEHKYGARVSTILVETLDEDKAVAALLGMEK